MLLFGGISADAQSDYRIRSGDTLQIEVLEDPGLNRSVLVLPDGSISFPFVNTLQARGMSVSDVRRSLAAGLAPNFAAEPTVVVSVAAVAEPRIVGSRAPLPDPTIDVYIMGEVAAAGKKEVSPGTTILQFLAESGGLTSFAAKSRIELHRTDPATGRTTVYLFSRNGRGKGPRIGAGTTLAPGDVVVVPSRHLFE
ncbi:MAG: polysaccharide biosynthesis/export family protein [Rhodobacter sp.]|nr:polysaccharide biosynthesis/export family protein [Rhodobacter sp.]